MPNYITIKKDAQAEFVEKRSRFIATVRKCETEAEALAFLDEMRSKYWDATHNCFAYIVEKGKTARFSDDGEPHGTAGKPMLDVLQGSGVVNAAVVVTRYFGGVLLGTGGLVRAYSRSIREGLEAAGKVEMVLCSIYNIMCPYSDHGKLQNLLEDSGANIESTEFTDKVGVTYALKEEMVESFERKLTEFFAARLTSQKIGEKTVPMEISLQGEELS